MIIGRFFRKAKEKFKKFYTKFRKGFWFCIFLLGSIIVGAMAFLAIKKDDLSVKLKKKNKKQIKNNKEQIKKNEKTIKDNNDWLANNKPDNSD